MLWFEQIAKKVDGPQVVNDSKTPSGRVHVGALRGVLVHYAASWAVRAQGGDATYRFGIDDYDPMDELPADDGGVDFREHLGRPLCRVPAPPGSDAPNLAEHFAGEFIGVFDHLGIAADFYRTSRLYGDGHVNEEIHAVLSHPEVIREIYLRVSGSQKPDDWYPFQVVCESCGRIGTTVVTGYDGKEVTYDCRPGLVTWATGCGHHGKMSPFDGGGKLPWKLEWAAKWHHFGVTIEGAGKDHCTKGGSRDVAGAVVKRLFGQPPPVNIPYEFFLVEGAKMSSSRGVGASAKEISDLLPPALLKYLMLSRRPNQQVNFSPEKQTITNLFNQFDRTRQQALGGDADARTLLELCGDPPVAPGTLDFGLVTTFLQIPRTDLYDEAAKRKGAPLDDAERADLTERMDAGRYWLERYASEDDRVTVLDTLPAGVAGLTDAEKGFLHVLADVLAATEWAEKPLQGATYDAARQTPIAQPRAFRAFYQALLGRDSGPRAGSLLSVLEPDFVLGRLREAEYSESGFFVETASAPEAFEEWIRKNRDKIESAAATLHTHPVGCFEVDFRLADGKTERKRMLSESLPGDPSAAHAYLDGLAREHGFAIAE